MACGCETYNCVDVWVNPCNTGTFLGIEATETGTYTALVEFNGNYKKLGIQADEGDEMVILTSVLNEQYTHELRLTSPSGVQTCYKLKTHPTFNVSGAPVPPPITSIWQWFELDVDSDIVTSDFFEGDISPEIYLNGNGFDWEQSGVIRNVDSLDFTAIGGAHGKLTGMYKL